MRILKSDFMELYGQLKSMPDGPRAKLLSQLKGADVYEVDASGAEVEIEVEIDEKAIAAEIESLNKSAVARNRKVSRIIIEGDSTIAPMGKSLDHLGRSNVFKGNDAQTKAHRWGMFALASLGNERAKAWCDTNGLVVKAGQNEAINSVGGILVPEVLINDLIDLRLEYGVFRRNAHYTTMSSDLVRRPRRTGGLTAYFVNESAPGTTSTATWDSVTLTAKKLMVLAKMSSEVEEDAVINLGDTLASEIAYAFAYKEDLCGFNGDGTSTYGGIEGVVPKLIDVNGVDDGGGIVLASGNLYSEITLADLHKVIARVPSFARREAKWFVSPSFHDGTMQRLAWAAGGVTAMEIVNGSRTPTFMGYPVELIEVMPTAEANSQVVALFGDLKKAASFGERRVVTIDFDKSATVDGVNLWMSDEIGVRGTERIDINVHDVGTASQAGPIVGLMTAAA